MLFLCVGRLRCLCYTVLLGICAIMCESAMADTNLVDNGFWVIDGTDDTGTNPTNITLSVDGHPVSSFSELILSYNVGGSGVVTVCTIKGSGGIRLSLPPPGEFGGTFFTTGYQDCDEGLIPTMSITDLDIRAKKGKNGDVQFKGKISNFTSMEAKDFTMTFSPPDVDSTSV